MKFVIKGTFYKEKTFPGLNDYISELGRNPRAGNRMKQDYMVIASNAIRRELKRYKATGPVILHYAFYEPLKGHERDAMNIFSFADKVIEDALVKCKVLADDNQSCVKNTTHEFYKSNDPRIEVWIEELKQ